MRRALITVLALTFLVTFVGAASAADLKIGVVDVEYVILKSKAGTAAKDKLKKLFDKKQKELDEKQKELLDLKGKLENPSSMLTDDKKKEMLRTYQEGLMALQEAYLKNQQDLAKKEQELMKPILKDLEEVLTKMAEEGGYDMIVNRSQQGVLWSKKDHDITEAVIKKLDAK
ncbi:MAG: OmpH family outer membrane protein [Myxococcales bacterium]|nr:OmpH family outer membrane protein [Myxococcales bacterium]MCB9733469.1 OmpH family outer membrane protein [Deltaproteobacteria bacterium]